MITRPVKLLIKSAVTFGLTRLLGDTEGRVALRTMRGPAKGLKFRLDLGRLEYPYWLGHYESNVLTRLVPLIQPGWTIWDCGTHLGFYTCLFARLVGSQGRVISFEPDPHNLSRTASNVKLNGFDEIVECRPYAIGLPRRNVDFVLSCNTNSHLPGVYVGSSRDAYARIEHVESIIQVRSVSLDEIHAEHLAPQPNMIKLDIEGAELFALDHAAQICAEARPFIVLELHNRECDRAAWGWSRKVNYELHSLHTGEMLRSPEAVRGTLLCSPCQ